MLDQVTSMRVFLKVVALGSLAAAGRALGLSQTMVTRHVDALEAKLGTSLLQRSTRRLALTEAGRTYVELSQRILADLDEAEQIVSSGRAEPQGLLRISLPVSFGLMAVMPLLAEFTARYPKVVLDVGFTDRLVDLIDEGWDLALRVGALGSTSLVARRLTGCATVVCAAPAYLEAHGTPKRVDDLARHNCLGYTLSDRLGTNRWHFGPDASIVADVTGTLRTNHGDALRQAALAGLGIIYQPIFIIAEELRQGTLVAIELDHAPSSIGDIHVVFHRHRHMPPKTRAMINYLVSTLGRDA